MTELEIVTEQLAVAERHIKTLESRCREDAQVIQELHSESKDRVDELSGALEAVIEAHGYLTPEHSLCQACARGLDAMTKTRTTHDTPI